jgi:hypothetical protein
VIRHQGKKTRENIAAGAERSDTAMMKKGRESY